MAAAGSIDLDIQIGEAKRLYSGRISLDSSHLAAGEAVDFSANVRMDVLLCECKGGYAFAWDADNQKLLVYYGDNNNAADGPLIAVPDTTDLSALTDVQFLAIGS